MTRVVGWVLTYDAAYVAFAYFICPVANSRLVPIVLTTFTALVLTHVTVLTRRTYGRGQ